MRWTITGDEILRALGITFLCYLVIASIVCPIFVFRTNHHDVAVVVTNEQWEYLDQGFPQYRLWVDKITPIQITDDGDNFLIIEFATRFFEGKRINEILPHHVEAYYVIN